MHVDPYPDSQELTLTRQTSINEALETEFENVLDDVEAPPADSGGLRNAWDTALGKAVPSGEELEMLEEEGDICPVVCSNESLWVL